jgi:hypothetical protein
MGAPSFASGSTPQHRPLQVGAHHRPLQVGSVLCKWVLQSTTQKKLKKAKVGLLKRDVLELHVPGQ